MAWRMITWIFKSKVRDSQQDDLPGKKTSFENHNNALKPTPLERMVKVSWKCGSDFKHQASA